MWSLRPLIKGTGPKVAFSGALSLVLWCSYHFIVHFIQCRLRRSDCLPLVSFKRRRSKVTAYIQNVAILVGWKFTQDRWELFTAGIFTINNQSLLYDNMKVKNSTYLLLLEIYLGRFRGTYALNPFLHTNFFKQL